MQPSLNNKSSNKKYVDVFFGAVLRFAIGIGYYNPQDTLWYKAWAMELNNGLFSIYSRADSVNLDYPPIYLFFLKITGGIYSLTGESVHNYTEMFIMKLWPILGDIICAAALFYVFKKQSPKSGLVVATLWMFNPSVIFNCAFWGQTDSIMCLLLLVSFVALDLFLEEKAKLHCWLRNALKTMLVVFPFQALIFRAFCKIQNFKNA